jgi:pre-mRNA-splicing factor CWC26
MKRWRAGAFEQVSDIIGPQMKVDKSLATRRNENSSDDSDPELDRRSSNKSKHADLSPPRRPMSSHDRSSSARRHDRPSSRSKDDDLSPVRNRARLDNETSPARRQIKQERASSPATTGSRFDNDMSPPRRRSKHDDSVTSRHKSRFDDDRSPPRRQVKHEPSSPVRRSTTAKTVDNALEQRRSSPSRKRHDESSESRRDNRHVSSESRHRSGDKHRSTSNDRPIERQSSPVRSQPVQSERRRQAEHKEKISERYAVWGRGVAQVQQQHAAVQDYLEQADKPLARYRDDKDLDVLLKQREREGKYRTGTSFRARFLFEIRRTFRHMSLSIA